MLSKADPQDIDLPAKTDQATNTTSLIRRKIWLPKVVYDALPWFYLVAGMAAFLATLYISAWFWILPHYLLFSAACLHLGLIILRRRKRQDSADQSLPVDR